MNKIKSAMAINLLAFLLCSVGFVSAYLFVSRYKVNMITVGDNAIDIVEEYNPPDELVPGDNIYQKRVQIENTGTVVCFVRVFADFSDSSIKDLSELSPDGFTYYPANGYGKNLPSGWVYVDEETDPLLGGFYYYTDEVLPDKKTTALFESVKTTFENADEIRDYDIIIYSESVQVRDKNGEKFPGDDPWKQAWTEFMERR